MTDKEQKSSAESKSRFAGSHDRAPSPIIGSAAEFIKLYSAELTLVVSGLIGVTALCLLGSAFFSYELSHEITSSIAGKKLENSLQQLNLILTVDPFLDTARFDRGRVLVLLKRNKEALDDFNTVLEHHPKQINALQRRSVLCVGLNKFEQVIADCNTLIELQKEQTPVYVYANRAGALAMVGKKEEALADYSRAIRMQPSDASLFLGRAWTYQDMKKLPEAMEDFEWVTMLKPGSVDAALGKAHILILQKKYGKALTCLNDALKANPENSKLFLERGKLFWTENKSKDALSDFAKAITLDPKNNDALLQSMRANSSIHNDTEALKAANMLVLNGCQTYEVYMKRSDLDFDLKKYEMAALGYQRAAELQSNEVEPLLKRARALGALKQYKLAIACLNKAIKIKSADPLLYVFRGIYLKDDKQYDDARADFDKALVLKPGDTDAILWRGQNFCDQQDWKNAKQDFEQVLRVDPKSRDAARFLAFVNRGLTNFGKLRNAGTTSTVASAAPTLTDPKVKALLATGSFDEVLKEGVNRYNSRQFSDAIALLSKAVKLNGAATSARRYLAQALMEAGDPGNAIAQYQAVIAQQPGSADDLNALATALFNAHRYEDTITYESKFLELKPHDFDGTCRLIEAYKESGFTKKAQDVCKAAIHAANGITELSKYEDLMNNLSQSPRRENNNSQPVLPNVDIGG